MVCGRNIAGRREGVVQSSSSDASYNLCERSTENLNTEVQVSRISSHVADAHKQDKMDMRVNGAVSMSTRYRTREEVIHRKKRRPRCCAFATRKGRRWACNFCNFTGVYKHDQNKFSRYGQSGLGRRGSLIINRHVKAHAIKMTTDIELTSFRSFHGPSWNLVNMYAENYPKLLDII